MECLEVEEERRRDLLRGIRPSTSGGERARTTSKEKLAAAVEWMGKIGVEGCYL